MPKAASLALALLVAALPAAAQPLYKWVDEDGKTQYSDKPPKGFKGSVRVLESEVDKTTLPPPAPVPPPAPAPISPAAEKVKAAAPAEDIAAKRRATRTLIEARLTKARENLEAARKALAQAESPDPEERQIIQQRVHGGMHGMTGRSNCRWEGTGKQKTLMCPTFVPTEEYHDRVAKLEEGVRKAEEELADAERAWRRGVD